MDPTLDLLAQSAPPTAAPDAVKDESLSDKEVASYFKSRIEAAKRNRKRFAEEWKTNVELRLGRPTALYTGGVTVETGDQKNAVNPDWALTKTKTANLFSQVPMVQGTHENKEYAPAVPMFMKELNFQIGEKRANVAVPMEEVLNDVVNAAGVGGVVVGYAARFHTKMVPDKEAAKTITDPAVLQQMEQTGLIKLIPTKEVTDYRFFATRLSPTSLLWPAEFKGSDFDNSSWLGYQDRMSWGEAKSEFKLNDADKETVLGASDTATSEENLQENQESRSTGDLRDVRFTRIYYWRYRLDPEEPSFSCIWQIAWVEGKPDPVLHEQWHGQELDPATGQYIGARRFPLRVLTLTYITDNPVPPSDSAAGRPQVNDMRRSRAQMFMNRDRSRPLRWHDVNRIDPEIAATIMRGTWQNSIPVNGDGTRVMGEVARASYPAEDMSFDQQTKADLMEMWQIGPNQLSQTSGGDTTKGEAEIVQANFATRIGQERARVATFFLGIVDVIAGLVALYSDYPSLTPQERDQMMQVWNPKQLSHELVLKVRPDSTIVLDSTQRTQRLSSFLNLTAKSGYVNVLPIITEMAELAGLDPTEVIKQPQPPPPDEPTISYRFSGKEDLQNPVVMAMLVKAKQAPSPEDMDAAKKILQNNLQPPAPPQPPPGPPGAPGQGGPPLPVGPPPPPALPPDHNEHPNWHLGDKIAKRSRDIGE